MAMKSPRAASPFEGKDVLEMEIEERAQAGLLLGFQYPVEIPGVKNIYLLKSALNAQRKARGEEDMPAPEFMKLVKEKLGSMKMDASFLQRAVNEGFLAARKSATKFSKCWCFSLNSPCWMTSTPALISTP